MKFFDEHKNQREKIGFRGIKKKLINFKNKIFFLLK
jgi:hypothetical protein